MLSRRFAAFVVSPGIGGGADRDGLALLGAAAEQYYKHRAVLAEIDSVTGAEVDAVLEDSAADALHVRKIALPEPVQRRAHFGACRRVELVEPSAERRAAGWIEVFGDADLGHGYGNVQVTIRQAALDFGTFTVRIYSVFTKVGDRAMARARQLEKARSPRKDLTVSHRERLIAELRADRKLAAAYLNAAAEDKDRRVYLSALRTVAGGM